MKYHSFNQITLIGRVEKVREVDFTNGTKTYQVEMYAWWFFVSNGAFKSVEMGPYKVLIPRVKKHADFVLRVVPNSILMVQGKLKIKRVVSTEYFHKVTGKPLTATFYDIYADMYIPFGGEEVNEHELEKLVRESRRNQVNPEHLRMRDTRGSLDEE